MNKVFLAMAITLSLFTASAYASGDEYGERGEYYERREEVKFYGTVESLPEGSLNGTWIVNGRQVIVTPSTRIKEEYGPVAVGVQVEVEGGGNPLTAYKIETKGTYRR